MSRAFVFLSVAFLSLATIAVAPCPVVAVIWLSSLAGFLVLASEA